VPVIKENQRAGYRMPETRRAGRLAPALMFAVAILGTPQDEASAQRDRSLPATAVNARLDSLEQVALSSGSREQRLAAVARISAPGWLTMGARKGSAPIEVRYQGIVDRLVRIYQRNDDYWMRYSVIAMMIPQAERAEAAAFLEEVAEGPGEQPVPPPGVVLVEDRSSLQSLAVGALTYLGAEGEAALRRLHAAGTVREALARAELERLASAGFRQSGRP